MDDEEDEEDSGSEERSPIENRGRRFGRLYYEEAFAKLVSMYFELVENKDIKVLAKRNQIAALRSRLKRSLKTAKLRK